MPTLLFCETYITEGTIVVGPDDKQYRVTDTRFSGSVREYELATLNGQWSNWFPYTDIVCIVKQP